MKRIFRIMALLMATLIAVTSCQAPDSGSQLSDGTVDVSFAGPSARTITTDDGLVQTVATSDLWFQYKAVWQGEDPVPSTARNEWTSLNEKGLSSTVKLHRGTWDLSLRAFVNESEVGEDDKFILSGTLPGVAIGANNLVTQTVSINLGYVRQEGNGTLHISATYPVVYHEGVNPESPVEAVRKVKVTANVADTDYTGEITAFNAENVGTLDLTVPAGAAHVTVQYYMDENTLFEDDQTGKDVLIMATMTTNLAVSVDRNITAITFKAEQPTGTVEDNLIKATSLFDIYPGPIADNAIVIGYAEETKALGDQIPITYPYISDLTVSKDDKGRYKASDLGLVPITVTTGDELIASGATEAWWGKTAASGSTSTPNTTLAAVRFVDDVTSIGQNAFFCCSGLTSVTIPESVTSIGNQAFAGCGSLTSITIPSSVTEIGIAIFWWCSGLTSVTIQNGITSIGFAMFLDCSSLTDITIPESVTAIGGEAFHNCTSLTNFAIPESVTEIDSYTFSGCTSLTNITITDGVTSIGSYAFENCTSLTSVTIPDSVTEIGSQAFQGCTNLTSVTIPPSVTEIGWYAFKGCTSLTDITIPEGVTSIKNYTFLNCSSLTSITIPNTVTSIGNEAFHNCSSLTSITLPDGVTEIGDYAFAGCTVLTNITIPDGVTSIGETAFASCKSFTSITIPNGVTSIEYATFASCSGLTSITIPSSVTKIGGVAFQRCSGLTSITIPNNVTEIEWDAFAGCTSLTHIYVNQAESSLLASASVPDGCIIHWNSTGPESVPESV